MSVFEFSPLDFLFTCVGLLCLLADIGLDVFAVVSFYQEKAYVSLGLLLLFLVGSSVLVQIFSWLWYSYEDFKMETKVESSLGRTQLKLLHVFQLGIYVRHAGVVEMSLRSFFTSDSGGYAVYLSHDLSLLRLIETFSEGATQFVLMLTLILQKFQLDLVTVLKAIGSASAIACSVTMYHRSLRSFVPDKQIQNIGSSLIYFLWNMLLISSRLTALALFASVMPCFIFTHFICSWMVLFFFAWQAKTDLMESPGGEWLYRATVGLIWYFDWFNVVGGRTRNRTLLYHGYMLADISLLCGLWCWKMNTEPPYFEIPHLYAVITAVSVVGFYILGLLFKIIYYKCYHPNVAKEELKGGTTGQGPTRNKELPRHKDSEVISPCMYDDTDYTNRMLPSELSITIETDVGLPPAPTAKRYNKRMRKLAENFYS